MFWNWEMAQLTGAAKYSDLFEWQLYNAAAVGMGLDGQSYLYNNPLACRGGIARRAWYGIPCCPSNLSRTWADLGKYIYSTGEENVWIHQYVGSRATVGALEITLESGLPFAGSATIKIGTCAGAQSLRPSSALTLHLRLPAWSAATHITVNKEPVAAPPLETPAEPASGGYDPRPARFLSLRREWSAGDTLVIEFDMGIALRRAGPRVKGHAGKVAVTRGPLVYCLESVDNPGVDLFACHLDPASLRPEPAPDLLGGIQVLRGATLDGRPLTFIPYSLWANRGPSQMNVWIKT
jgi:DUF1680 family protein